MNSQTAKPLQFAIMILIALTLNSLTNGSLASEHYKVTEVLIIFMVALYGFCWYMVGRARR